MSGTPVRVVILTLLLAACGSSTPPQPSAGPRTTEAATASTAPTDPATSEPSATSQPGDGVPDPAGRIAFGRITRQDPNFGQVIAIWAIDPDGSDLLQLNEGESAFPAWSPDGSRLAFTQRQADGSWQIATMAPDGSDVRVLTTDNVISEVPSWSPDGTWLAYDSSPTLPGGDGFHTTLWRIDADGSNPTQLGDPSTFDVEPRVSPDGTEVAFERLTFDGGIQRQALVVRDIETGVERVITAAGTAVEHANWSPDGAWLIYDVSPVLGGAVPNDQVERIAADGSGVPVVLFPATEQQGGFKPWYSPDGGRILFGCFMGGPASSDAACLMDADGSNVEILVNSGEHENHFSWGPPTRE